jgi:hypothetical protein
MPARRRRADRPRGCLRDAAAAAPRELAGFARGGASERGSEVMTSGHLYWLMGELDIPAMQETNGGS